MEANETPRKDMERSGSDVKESCKDPDPDANSIKGASKASSAEKRRENGLGVSVNGEGTGGDDLGDGEVVQKEVSTGNGDFGDRKVVSLDGDGDDNNDVGFLLDSEMNGVSSLLKMQESGCLKGLSSVLDVIDKNEEEGSKGGDDGAKQKLSDSGGICGGDSSKEGNPDAIILGQDEDREEEDTGDDEHEFNVGDFVWGKIKSHPWWPGRIHDPLDASDYAKKVKPRDRILVAYFGDGTFAWCNPSQLKPFEENFVEMSRQSNSKNFINAVDKAVEEVGRLVELEMTCSCGPKEDLIGLGRSLAANAGIKEGLLVPEGGVEKFSTAFFEPTEFLAAMKCIAQVATMSNMLELTVLKSWLSAFSRAKGGYHLPIYHDPQPVPGLEDDNRNWLVELSNYNGGMEVNIGGPVEEDWLSSPRDSKFDQTTVSLLQKCQGVPKDRRYQRRKQKSIAEILGGNPDTEAETKEDVAADEETKMDKLASLVKRKKRKDRGEVVQEDKDAEDKIKVGDMDKKGAYSGISASSSGGKKRKGHEEVDIEEKNNVSGVSKAGTDSSKPMFLAKRKKGKGTDEAKFRGSDDLTPKPRRKDRKPAESFIASENLISSNGISKESGKGPLLRRRKKRSNVEMDGQKNEMGENTAAAEQKMDGSSSVQNDDGEEQVSKSSLSRERKKSKYLCPPYTNLNMGQRNKEMEVESQKVFVNADVGERMIKATESIIGSAPTFKSSDEKVQKITSEVPVTGHEKTEDSGLQTPKQDQVNSIDLMEVKAPSKEILWHIQSTAVNPQCLNESESLGVVRGFFSAFRSSIYRNGSNYRTYNRHQRSRKRKSQEAEPGVLVKETNQADHGSPDHKSLQTKARKSEESKSVKRKSKKAATAADMKTNDKGSCRNASEPVSLGKTQDQSHHKSPNHKTRLTKVKKSEEAKSDKLKVRQAAKAPDTKTNLKEPDGRTSAAARFLTFGLESSLPTKDDLIKPSAADTPQLKYIKEKLEKMTSMLDTSDGKMTPAMKSKLEGEIKGLLKEVSSMVESST